MATEWLRSGPAHGIEGKVDRETGVIHGVAMVTEGEALGHGYWLDGDFVEATAALAAKGALGLKSRFGHPTLSGSAVGSFLGRMRNVRVEETVGADGKAAKVARGDLHISQAAAKAPQGDLREYVLALAEKDPQAFGTSIVFERDPKYRRNAKGEKVFAFRADGSKNDEYNDIGGKEFVGIKRLHANDVVDDPAANPGGMFSEFSAETTAAQVTEFLDAHPEVWDLLQEPDIREPFMVRYEAYLANKAATTHEESPTMADAKSNPAAPAANVPPTPAPAPAAAPEAMTATPAPEAPAPAAEPPAPVPMYSATDIARLTAKFGAAVVCDVLGKGGSEADMNAAKMAALEAENAKLRADNAAKLAAGAPPAAVDPANVKPSGKGYLLALCQSGTKK